MAPPVVVGARGAAVVGDGKATGGVRLDVVDLGVVGRGVAEFVEAFAISDLDGSAGGAGEDAPSGANVGDPVGPVEHHPFHPAVLEPADEAAGRNDGSVGQLAQPASEGFVANEHGEQRFGPTGIGGDGTA